MILVDTSVWIEVFRGKIHLSESEIPLLATCLPIYQEVLQGIRSDLQKRVIQNSMDQLIMLGEPLHKKTALRAIEIYRTCRKNGITIRSSVDCLIGAIAEENDVILWSLDRDLKQISRVAGIQLKS